jgi:hypothetical protein
MRDYLRCLFCRAIFAKLVFAAGGAGDFKDIGDLGVAAAAGDLAVVAAEPAFDGFSVARLAGAIDFLGLAYQQGISGGGLSLVGQCSRKGHLWRY